jgi:hypothetical protein
LTAAVRDGRTFVRAGMEEWLRPGPNQRMARNRRTRSRQIRYHNPSPQPSTKPGQVQSPCRRRAPYDPPYAPCPMGFRARKSVFAKQSPRELERRLDEAQCVTTTNLSSRSTLES